MNLIFSRLFSKRMKEYGKKFRSIEDDVQPVINSLEAGNLIGDEVDNLDKIPEYCSVYKVRIGNSDTNAGTSNGYRLIYYFTVKSKEREEIYVAVIYYKKTKSEVLDKGELSKLIRKLLKDYNLNELLRAYWEGYEDGYNSVIE